MYSLGIGQGVDEALVKNSANAGQGKYYFAKDSSPGHLNSLVIEALQDAASPYLKGCSFRVDTDGPGAGIDEKSLMPLLTER